MFHNIYVHIILEIIQMCIHNTVTYVVKNNTEKFDPFPFAIKRL